MDFEFGITAGCDIGDDADQRAGFDVEAGSAPKGAENGFGDDIDECLADGIFRIFGCVFLEL